MSYGSDLVSVDCEGGQCWSSNLASSQQLLQDSDGDISTTVQDTKDPLLHFTGLLSWVLLAWTEG